MDEKLKKFDEEITEFPVQDTFNKDDMSIIKEDTYDVSNENN